MLFSLSASCTAQIYRQTPLSTVLPSTESNPGTATAPTLLHSPTPVDLTAPDLTPTLDKPISTPFVLPTQLQEILPSPLPEPLRFTFPTRVSNPVTIWRPPLYPTPWEPTPNDHFYFARPIGANEVNWPLAKYRYGGSFFENTIHTGIDIPAPKGTPVMAAGPGKVVWAGYGLTSYTEDPADPYGIAVAIKHDFGYQGQALFSVYGHMQDYYIIRGQRVEGGDVIGLVGETGHATGPHLHFEVRLGDNNYNEARNPELWLAPPQGWGVLAARVMDTDGVLLEQQVINIRSLETNQYWYVVTYSGKTVKSDSYYRENMVIGDLPAGRYAVWINYEATVFDLVVNIQPGHVSYFRFLGIQGFQDSLPPTPLPNFVPPDATEQIPTATFTP